MIIISANNDTNSEDKINFLIFLNVINKIIKCHNYNNQLTGYIISVKNAFIDRYRLFAISLHL